MVNSTKKKITPNAPKSIKAPPRYQQIKDNLMSRIAAGEWMIGAAIPPEETLAKEFAVARMTVNRALKELTDAGVLRRTQGSGTFVAPAQVEASLLEIRNIADEIAERGHTHSAQLHLLAPGKANEELARSFGLRRNARLFRSIIVHAENGLPIQVEDRWVNAQVAPDYLAQDFTTLTPNAYLSSVAPLTAARYTVEARLPSADIAAMLKISPTAPCLVMCRTTLAGSQVASFATLWHPGERFRLMGGLLGGV